MPAPHEHKAGCLAQDGRDGAETFFDEVEWPAVQDEIHFRMIQADLMQDGGLKVADVMRLLNRLVANFIGGALDDSALDAASRQESRKALAVVVAPGGVL